jgi:hypothetical protein
MKKEKQPTMPSQLVTDPKFKYVPCASTDVRNTWRRFGWKPLPKRIKNEGNP